MRTTLTALIVAAGIGLIGAGSAAAMPAATATKQAATDVSAIQEAQYSERRTRRGIRKCYREFIVGRYVCRTYR